MMHVYLMWNSTHVLLVIGLTEIPESNESYPHEKYVEEKKKKRLLGISHVQTQPDSSVHDTSYYIILYYIILHYIILYYIKFRRVHPPY